MRYHKANGDEVIVYTNEEREKALSVSLTALAASMGYTPVRQGSHYILKEMDSLMIYNDRSWKRWSGKGNRTGGSQIDFLLEFGGVTNVPEAIQQLLEFKGEPIEDVYREQPKEEREARDFQIPPKNANYRRLYAYLIKTRGLSQEVVTDFVQRKLIYEDAVHHNIVYCGYDPEGVIRYAGLRGTADAYGKKFKMDVPGNDKNYGVNIVNKESSELKVFESVIDCMSYIDMSGDNVSNKLILGMVQDNPLEQFLKDYDHIKTITFCLDNDAAGHNAIYGTEDHRKPGLKEKYESRGYSVTVDVPPAGKDFNESLIALKASHIDMKEHASLPKTNSSYVNEFYDHMMEAVGFHRSFIESEEMATVKYVNASGEKYLSDGYGDCYSWIEDNPNIPIDQKEKAAKLNENARKICLVENNGNIEFYMENVPEEKYMLLDSSGMKYPSDKGYRIYNDFDGLLTTKEMDNLYSLCKDLERQNREEVNLNQNEEEKPIDANNMHRKMRR